MADPDYHHDGPRLWSPSGGYNTEAIHPEDTRMADIDAGPRALKRSRSPEPEDRGESVDKFLTPKKMKKSKSAVYENNTEPKQEVSNNPVVDLQLFGEV